jgi:hypothetical protein
MNKIDFLYELKELMNKEKFYFRVADWCGDGEVRILLVIDSGKEGKSKDIVEFKLSSVKRGDKGGFLGEHYFKAINKKIIPMIKRYANESEIKRLDSSSKVVIELDNLFSKYEAKFNLDYSRHPEIGCIGEMNIKIGDRIIEVINIFTDTYFNKNNIEKVIFKEKINA